MEKHVGKTQESLLTSDQPNKGLSVLIKKNLKNTLSIAVHDNGVGISPENQKRLFSSGFSTKQKGQGYSLHNSFLLARELHGTLEAQSDGNGCGATFTLTLPM